MKKVKKSLKRIIQISFTLFFFAIISSHCSQIKNCAKQCKNETNECLMKAYAYSAVPIGTTSTSSTSSNSSTNPKTDSEAESNDTFTSSVETSESITNSFNSLSSAESNSYLKNATISSSSDIDIFYTYLFSNFIGISITQKSGIGKVTCNVYSRNGTSTYRSTSSSPDSTFTFLGNLNTSYSYAVQNKTEVTLFYICSGTSGSSYSIQSDPYKPPTTNILTGPVNIFNYSTYASCAGADATCRTRCSTKL